MLALAPQLSPSAFLLAAALALGGCSHAASPGSPSQLAPDAPLSGVLLLGSAPPRPTASPPLASASVAPAVNSGPPPAASSAAPPAPLPAADAPPCGSLFPGVGAGITPDNVEALSTAYYKRTLRARVHAWARDTLGKAEPGSVKLVREMALRIEKTSATTPVPGTEAQQELVALAGRGHRVVCRAATVSDRPLWRVNFFTELPPPHLSDIGMVLVMFVDAASGEVVLVVYAPLIN